MSSRFFLWINEIITKIEESSPQTITNKDQFRLITKAENFCGLYDGKMHHAVIETVHDCEVLFSEDNKIWKSTAPSLMNSGVKTVYIKASRNKRIEFYSVVIEIQKRNITITSYDAEKEYDGTILVNKDVTISGDGLVEGEGISAVAVGSITTVGQKANEIEYSFDGKTNAENYSVKLVAGTLSVVEREQKIEITLKGSNKNCIYDSEIKEISGLEKSTFDYLGQKYVVNGIETGVCAKNAGRYEAQVIGKPQILDSEGRDVSEQFSVKIIPGVLSIQPRNVFVESSSITAEYTGDILSSLRVSISGDGFIEADHVKVSTNGQRIIPGISSNKIEIIFSENVQKKNYIVNISEGIIEVTDRVDKPEITVKAKKYEYLYDGTEAVFEEKISYPFEENGHSYLITGASLRVNGMNAGTYYGELIGEPKVYDKWNNDVSKQFTIILEPSILHINRRHIILKSGTAKKEYDGWKMINDTIEIFGDGIVEKDVFGCNTIAEIITVGAVDNKIVYTFSEGNEANYEIELQEGKLIVTDRDNPYLVEFSFDSRNTIYDGAVQLLEDTIDENIEINGKTYHVSGIKGKVEGLDAGQYRMIISGEAAVTDEQLNNVTKQFAINVLPGYLNIDRRKIQIISGTSLREYDGTELINEDVTYEGDGFVDGEGVAVETAASITTVGQIINKLEYSFFDGTNPVNYVIETSAGLLTVLPREKKIEISIQGNSLTCIYDGEEKEVAGLEQSRFDYNGNTFEVSGITLIAKGTDAGTYQTYQNGNIIVLDSENKDVSDQFNINIVPGELKINPREVILKSDSAWKEYDGTILTNEHISVGGDGFCDDEMPEVQVLGRQKLIGESKNVFTYTWPDTELKQNYRITEEIGTLKVIDRQEKFKLKIEVPDEVSLYDSNEHTISASESREVVIGGATFCVEINDTGISAHDAGIYSYVFAGTVIVYDEERNDVTDQFEITITGGTLEIQKRQITITPLQACKDYDGKELFSCDAIIGGDGFVINEGIELYSNSSLMLPGRCENHIAYRLNSGTNPDNYIIMVQPGELIIFDKYPKYDIQITGDSVEELYDETEKELPEFSNLDFVLNDCLFHIQGITNKVTASEEGVYQADTTATLYVYDDYWNDVTSQFEVDVQYGTLTILHNAEYDVPEIEEGSAEEIDEYDITIREILNEMSGTPVTEQAVVKYSRKELESLYVDRTQLLSGRGTVDPRYELGLELHAETNEFSILRNRIVKDFIEADLLCQIEISDSEYRQLKNYFCLTYVNNKRNGKQIFVDILFSVFLVQIGIRYYESNFWPHVAEVLGVSEIDQTDRPWVGGTVTKTLLAFGKPVFSENEYVTNILMHSFVTDPFAKRFFDYIFQYYSIDMERDLSGIQAVDIAYLCDSIINPYAKRKQLLSKYTAMSIRGGYDYCKQIITNALHMIDCSFWDEEYDEYVLTGRLARRFEEWKEQSDFYQTEKRKIDKTGNRNRLFRTPHLTCDIENGKFAITLPPQLVRVADENELPDVRWFVVTKERREFSCNLVEGYLGYKTNAIIYYPEPDQIFEKHVFLLFVNKEMVRSFMWDKRKVNFFTPNGTWVKGERLEPGLSYAFGQDDSDIVSDALVYVSRKNSLKFYELNLHNEDFVCVPGENNYYIGTIPKSGLSPKGNLEDARALHMDDEREQYPVYSVAPTLVIDIEQEQYQGLAIIINKQVHKLSAVNYTDVRLGRTTERKYYFVDTQSLTGIRMGWNKVVVDYPKTPKHYVYDFYYAPALHYEFEGAPYIFADNGTLLIQKCSSVIQNDDVCQETRDMVQKQRFTMTELRNGHIYHEFDTDCILRIAVPMLRYSWDDIHWNYCKMEELWHADLQDIIYLEYPDSKINLCVAGGNEFISMISYRKQQSGKIVCDLTKLKSYFRPEKMEETINLVVGEVKIPLIKILQKSFLFSVQPSCDYEEEIIRVYFDVIGKNTYYAELYCDGELISEMVELNDQIAEFSCYIETADYTVKLYESDDDFGFDEEYDLVGEKSFSLINPLELIGGCMKVTSVNYAGNEFETREDYAYYLFIDEQISTSTYKGIVSGVFHKKHVMHASKAIITIPDLNEISKVHVARLTYSEQPQKFVLDLTNKAVVEERRKTKDARYHDLSEEDIWEVEYISPNSRRKKESIDWIENHEKARKRANTIWKID